MSFFCERCEQTLPETGTILCIIPCSCSEGLKQESGEKIPATPTVEQVSKEVMSILKWSDIPESERKPTVAFNWLKTWVMTDKKPEHLAELVEVWRLSFADLLSSERMKGREEQWEKDHAAVVEYSKIALEESKDIGEATKNGAWIARLAVGEALSSTKPE